MASMLARFGRPETFVRASNAAYSSGKGYVLQDCGNNVLCVAFSGAVEASAFSQTDTEFGVCKINENHDYFVSAVDGTTRKEREAASVFKVVLIKFLAIWKDLEAQVAEALATGKTVVFTGHNIGGGIATLATVASLEKWGKGAPVFAITFGFPLIGDEILARAVRRQGWADHFLNVVSKSDVFARTLLVPCISVSAFLEALLPYWQRSVEQMNGGDTDILMEPADVDFKKYMLTVLHHACAVVNLTTVNNMEPAVKLSPYRPFGCYLFCSEKGALFVENYEAVLPILFHFLDGAQDEANISDHIDYGRVFHGNTSMVNLEGLQNLSLSQGAELASAMEMQLDALGLGIQVTCSQIMASPESQTEQITCASQPEQTTCASPPYQQRQYVTPATPPNIMTCPETQQAGSSNAIPPYQQGDNVTDAIEVKALLTANAIRSINIGEYVAEPVLQILSFKRFTTFEDLTYRYKIALSDGNYMQIGILPEKCNELFFSEQLKIKSIISLTKYVCRQTTNSRTIIILSLNIIHQDYQIIGRPKYLYKSHEEQMQEEKKVISPIKTTKYGIHIHRKELPLPQSISPIKELNPYQSRWTIKGRVTKKKEMRQFNNQRGTGQVFSFDILDNEGTETRIVCYNEVAELHYDRVHIGAAYTISKGSVKEANIKYNKLNSRIEITLDHTSILKCCDEELPAGSVHYNFKPINEIANINNNTLVDIIGVVVSVGDISTMRQKDGTEVLWRTIKLMDISLLSIDVTLWGPICLKEGDEIKVFKESHKVLVISIRNGRVGEFKGKVINTTTSTVFTIEPAVPEAESLRSKITVEQIDTFSFPISSTTKNITSNSMTISTIFKDFKTLANPIEVTIKATIKFIRNDSFCYPACPLHVDGKECTKKCIENKDKTWYCSRCEKNIPECNYKYLLHVKLQDHTSSIWTIAFDKVGTNLLQMSAKDLYMLQYDTIVDTTPEYILKLMCFNSFIFTISLTSEVYNSKNRVKATITKAEKMNFQAASESLLSKISKILA